MRNKIKIILAEDEPSLALIIKESLETRDFEVLHCIDGFNVFELYKTSSPDILVLDVMMPRKDGYTVAKEIRAVDKNIPIIFLTAKSQTADVVEGFKSGGNDYLKKPFSMEELIVRVHSLIGRNSTEKKQDIFQIGSYSFNYTNQTLQYLQIISTLTHRETELLCLLCHNRNEVLDRSRTLTKIWGQDDFFTGRSMDVFISKLRKKLSLDPSIQIINVRGQGYKFIF